MNWSNWSNWSDFIDMGGYALYVWGSFGVAALVVAGEVLSLRARRRALRVAHRQSASIGFGSPHEA